jgi:ADP-dependent NAD(P)H-hydrate dehydratase / NAD(P)H-hydrate epimerase
MFPAGKAVDSRAVDQRAVEKGIPSLILMENAAFSLYLEVVKVIDSFKPEKIVAFAGKGGNGGDSFALLRILKDRGCNIPMQIIPLFPLTSHVSPLTSHDTLKNFQMLPESVEITEMEKISGRVLVIDGMIGTGLQSNLKGDVEKAVQFINNYDDKFVVAIDIPTGLNSDNGRIMGFAVKADLTVTMGIYKTGLFAEKGPSICGKTVLGYIGANNGDPQGSYYFVEDNPELEHQEVVIDSYKNVNGHLLVIGGDIEKLGASIIAAESFMASGGGLVSAAFKKEVYPDVAGAMIGMMLADVDEVESSFSKYNSIVIGPGLAAWPFKKFDVLRNYKGCIIADAGMFDLMKKQPEIFDSLKNCKVVFTPHPGELSRFLDTDRSEPWIEQVERFPLEKNHILVAKSHSTFVRSTDRTVIAPHGARALSFGGTGDALAGVLAFETFRNGLEKGALRAVLKHREAGIKLEKEYIDSYHSIETLIELIGRVE